MGKFSVALRCPEPPRRPEGRHTALRSLGRALSRGALAALWLGLAATAPRADDSAPTGELGQRTAQLLAELIRIPSVNPPGGEGPVAERIAAELAGAGLEVRAVSYTHLTLPTICRV